MKHEPDSIRLIPPPRSLNRTGSVATVPPEAEPAIQKRPGRPESYSLSVSDDPEHPVTIKAATDAGLRHARSTLAQLRAQFGSAIPTLEVDDEPAIPVRGFMLDVSRDRVPRMDSLLDFAELLASLKINHLQLYTEHTFAYDGHEQVWRGWSPFTPDEIRRLDEHCASLGIELAANQNCFGHLAHWLRLPRYRPLAEITRDDQTWRFMHFDRSGPFSLCPTEPACVDFVRDLLDQLTPCFRSSLVNIGCDETYDVGQGRSRAQVDRLGKQRVCLDFVRRIVDVAHAFGHRPMMWADLLVDDPALARTIPDDVIALPWGYEPDAEFERWGRSLEGREVWFSPGTSSWRSITGRTNERRANIDNAIDAAITTSARGILLTDWGDVGHRQQFPISLPAIAQMASRAWNPDAPVDAESASLHIFGDADTFGWLEQLGDADAPLRAGLRNASALFTDMHTPLAKPADDDVRQWQAVRERLDELAGRMPSPRSSLVADELAQSLETARFACERAIRRRTGGDTRGLAVGLIGLIENQKRLWLARSRQGGLTSSIAHDLQIFHELDGA